MGYVDYVPEAGEVESVTVETGNHYRNVHRIDIFDDFLYESVGHGIGYYNASNNVFNLSTDEAKAAVERFHKKIASNEAKDRFYDNKTYEYDAVTGIRLKYKLKNGKTVVRTYSG